MFEREWLSKEDMLKILPVKQNLESEELNPCPFCGSKDIFIHEYNVEFSDLVSGCMKCKCGARGPHWISSDYDFLKKDIEKAWNKRNGK